MTARRLGEHENLGYQSDRTHHWGEGWEEEFCWLDHFPQGWPALVLPKRLGQERGPEGLRISGSWVGLGPWEQSPGETRARASVGVLVSGERCLGERSGKVRDRGPAG